VAVKLAFRLQKTGISTREFFWLSLIGGFGRQKRRLTTKAAGKFEKSATL
jgi:hypothetical protein